MLVYALNGMQEHDWLVRRHVEITGSVVLRGCLDPDGNVQLLEGSHRIAFAIELGYPITIVLFNGDEIIPNECEIESKVNDDKDFCAVSELLTQSLVWRGLYNQAMYDAGEHTNIQIIDPAPETGVTVHRRLVNVASNLWAAFPERAWQYPWGHCCNVEGKRVLVLGYDGCKQAVAFTKLGADVTIAEPCGEIPEGYDLVYDTVTDTPYHM
jgi:hypothetical protein